ncbi:MAG: lytic polysaccharide monooxygenase, partial [Fibrobacteria bacterium]
VELYDDKNPTANPNIVADKTNIKFTTKCQVPARAGHHVIYGEWGRTESTYQRFHGCIDVAFGATPIFRSGSKTKAAAGTALEENAEKVDALGRSATKIGAGGIGDPARGIRYPSLN